MKNAVKSTNFAILCLGIIAGLTLLSICILVILNKFPFSTLSLSFSFLFITIALNILFMAARKFGNNELEAASELVKKANIFWFLGLLSIYLSIIFFLLSIEYTFALAFSIIAIILVLYLLRTGKKYLKYW